MLSTQLSLVHDGEYSHLLLINLKHRLAKYWEVISGGVRKYAAI
jgi:hypothetical protein